MGLKNPSKSAVPYLFRSRTLLRDPLSLFISPRQTSRRMSDTFTTLTRLLTLISSITEATPVSTLKRLQKEVQFLRQQFKTLEQTLFDIPAETQQKILRLFDWAVTFVDIQLWKRRCSKNIFVESRPPLRPRRRSCCSVKDPRPQPSVFAEYLSRYPGSVCQSPRSFVAQASIGRV